MELTLNNAILPLPSWIWHNERENKPSLALARTWELAEPLRDASLYLACTGAVEVMLDGKRIAAFVEKPGNVDAFVRVAEFPKTLEAGRHELVLKLACTDYFPIAEVNAYLGDRRVGAIAFLEAASGYRLVTDERWTADGEPAAIVCLLGEEPFGDLDDSPADMVAGGFGDIRTFPIVGAQVLSSSADMASERLGGDLGQLKLAGTFALDAGIVKPSSDRLELFSHLRKQEYWKKMRSIQRQIGLETASSVLIDLGREYNARLRIANGGGCEVKLLWNGAESLPELDNYDGCITEYAEIGAEDEREFFTSTQGMRYVRLYMLGQPGTAFELSIGFESAHYPLEQAGTFGADAGGLADIYATSAHTSRICQQIGLWDGVKRDRLNWTFDFYLAAKSCYTLWNDHTVIRRAIRELGVGTPYGSWMNGICEYTLWWIKTLCEYYYHTGDKDFILEMKEPLARHMAWVEENTDPAAGGILPQATVLIEWTPLSDAEKQLGLQAIYRLTRDDLRAMLIALPELGLVCDWRIAEAQGSQFLADGNLMATAALGIASGYVTEDEARAYLTAYELQDPLTPLSAFQLAECYSKYDMHDRAYGVISAVWGGMLQRGATTFWEAVVLNDQDGRAADSHDALTTYTAYSSYRMSLCHAWSSTPVQWISGTVLGVKAAEAGYRTIAFEPHPVGGIRACEGTVSTPHGVVRASWRLDENGELHTAIDVPEGIRVIGREEADDPKRLNRA